MHAGHAGHVARVEAEFFIHVLRLRAREQAHERARAGRCVHAGEETFGNPGSESVIAVVWVHDDVLDVEVVGRVTDHPCHPDHLAVMHGNHAIEGVLEGYSSSLVTDVVVPTHQMKERGVLLRSREAMDEIVVEVTSQFWVATPCARHLRPRSVLVMSDGNDQYTFDNPLTRYDRVEPPVQHQAEPGIQADMTPMPDLGEHSYRGTGRLLGRRALITGGDSGIGGAVAIAFAREGADVAIAHLPEEQQDAEHVLDEIASAGRVGVSLPGDLTDPAYCRTLVEDAVNALGGIDILVNNAGKQIAVARLEDLSDEQFEATFRTNVFANFWITKAALPHLAPGSTIVNTASLEAYTPAPDRLDYASTKAAINNFSKGLAQQLAPRGIRVNVVAPGPTWTALQVSHGVSDEQMEAFDEESTYKRAGQPAELAPAYVFLASAESSYVSGETLNVNGGMPTP